MAGLMNAFKGALGMGGGMGAAAGGVGAAPAAPAAGAAMGKPMAGVAQGSVAPAGPAVGSGMAAPFGKQLGGIVGGLGGKKMGGFMGRMMNNPALQQKLQRVQASRTMAMDPLDRAYTVKSQGAGKPMRAARGFRGGRR